MPSRRRIRMGATLGISFTMMLATMFTAPAHADETPPRITSISKVTSGTLTGGSRLAYRLSARDNYGLSWVSFRLQHETIDTAFGTSSEIIIDGYRYGTINGRTSVSGATSEIRLSRWVPSGKWRLLDVTVWDLNDNSTTYHRNGTVESWPEGGTSPTPLPPWGSGMDVVVENPHQDVTPPQVLGAERLFETVTAGEPQVATYRVVDATSGVSDVTFAFELPDGSRRIHLSEPENLAQVGPASYAIPLAQPGGQYQLVGITAQDRQYNSVSYLRDGTVEVSPHGIAAQPPLTFPLSGLDFFLNEVDPDAAAPTLGSLSRTSRAVVHPGERVEIAYAAGDLGSGVERIEFEFHGRDHGRGIIVSKRCGTVSQGPATRTMVAWGTRDYYRLQEIVITDRMGNATYLRRNGSVQKVPANEFSAHSFRFSSMDFTFADGANRTPEDQEYSNTSTEYCPPESNVTIIPDRTEALPDTPLDLVGKVTRARRAVRGPVIALYRYDGSRPRLLSVKRGSSTGTFSSRTTFRSTAVYRARFLGSAGADPALPRMSAGAEVRKLTRTRLAVRTSTDAIALGSSARVGGTLRRADTGARLAGLTVRLRARPAGSDTFTTIGKAITTENGIVRFLVRPRRSTEYRLRFTGTRRYAAITSATTRIRVRR